MTVTCNAVYQDGVLRPLTPTGLEEGDQVELIILSSKRPPSAPAPADILAGIAALPMEADDQGFSGQDHDRVLYGARERQ